VYAEELRARLELAGIPTQIEARVQVGPFKTRQEADAAREKLRALGMETGILTAVKR
jgi:DedD protein